jgi:hypothetical protein
MDKKDWMRPGHRPVREGLVGPSIARTYWSLVGEGHTATAVLCQHPLGWELRIVEGDELRRSRVYRHATDAEDDGAIFTDILDFCARVLAIQGGKGRSLNSGSDPGHGSAPLTRWDRARSGSPRGRLERTSARGPWSERWSALGSCGRVE